MAQYTVDAILSSENRNEAIKRFSEGGALQMPDGATLVGRWQRVGELGAWMVVETDNPQTLYDSLLKWNDIIDTTVTPSSATRKPARRSRNTASADFSTVLDGHAQPCGWAAAMRGFRTRVRGVRIARHRSRRPCSRGRTIGVCKRASRETEQKGR